MTDLGVDQVRTGTPRPTREELERQLEQHRRELTGYCYRMLGSAFDADDAVQDTLVRAWKALDKFDGRSSLRSWVYRIATNVCLDSLNGRQRRALPMDLSTSPSAPVIESLGEPLAEITWLEPVPDAQVLPERGDPADLAVARESIRLAFVSALQHLPPRQRAVLILREVLRWRADEVAQLLEVSVPAVNSALQRARATMASHTSARGAGESDGVVDEQHKELLAKYVSAFERYDIESLVALLHDDARQSMPPYGLWLLGPENIGKWHLGPGAACRGSRLLPVVANGMGGVAQYKPSAEAGRFDPWAIHAIEVSEGRIIQITNFLDTRLFALFGLPPHLHA